MQPPIAPIGLDYVAEALNAAGHQVELLDLCWEENPESALANYLKNSRYGLIGVTLRNTDDCVFTNRHSFLGEFSSRINKIREYTDAPIVLGGVGFSVMPEQVLSLSHADIGIWGEGEFVLTALADRLEKKEDWHNLPNLIWRNKEVWQRNPHSSGSLADLPPMSRKWVDNRRYFLYGGQAGFETKRGCPSTCIYCADPVAKGNQSRLRPPEMVADELERLLEQGIDHLHTCDGEFNVPGRHSLEVCREMIRRGLGKRLRWYAYCAPAPFSRELAKAMHDAGCAGINFGADNGDEKMLKRLGRNFGATDILDAVRFTKAEGMSVMLDLLLGSPGETKQSLAQTVELVKRADPDRAGVSLGVRIYPGTELARQVESKDHSSGLVGGGNSGDPLFYLDPQIATFAFQYVDSLIGDDKRFLFFDPSRPKQNYNYNANQKLVDAIQQGYRGAYWDILRRIESA
jgi:radical SAM superfamily enzyme YgiQ (UPF0313 family)